jgi:hypothetical protein
MTAIEKRPKPSAAGSYRLSAVLSGQYVGRKHWTGLEGLDQASVAEVGRHSRVAQTGDVSTDEGSWLIALSALHSPASDF